MSTRFKSSKYRHSTGAVFKREQWYVDLRPSTAASDAQCIAASEEHIAVVWESGTSVAVLNNDQIGKQKKEPSKIHAHSSQIYDIQFSPFDAKLLATGADDGHLRVWKIPAEGLTQDLGTPERDLQAHRRRTAVFRFNPTANQILASGGNDSQVAVWDLEAGTNILNTYAEGNVQGLSWNYDGSLLAYSTSSNVVSVWDPRAKNVTQTGNGHKGIKPSRLSWLGRGDYFVTTGFGQMRERQFFSWDSRNLSKPFTSTNIDSGTGIMEPFYDADTSILYLAGKGDGNIRGYEWSETAPNWTELQQVVSDVPTKSACLFPKRSLKVMDCEINRILKLTANAIAPIGFNVPRKSKVNFATELYPHTAGPIPALTASEWTGGETKDPILVSLDPSSFGLTKEEKQEIVKQEEETRQREIEEEEARNKKELPKLNIVRTSKFRHVVGKLDQRTTFFENVKSDNASSESETIKANNKWVAVPWSGAGGQLLVLDINKPGRTPNTPGLIECGASQLDMDFHPFDDDLIATGLDNATIKLWKIPSDLIERKQNFRDATATLKGHYSKVTITKFHPTASNVLTTASFDNTIKLWDVEKSQEQLSVKTEDVAAALAWSYNGATLATTSKDKTLRLIDPRSGQVTATANDHPGSKTSRITFAGDTNRLISVGFSRASDRQFSIWDTRNLSSPLGTTVVDTCSGLMTPYFDESNSILYLLGKGDGTIPYYEIVDEAPYAHLLSKFQTSDPQVGVAILPKTRCNVADVELVRMLKLTTHNIQPIIFTVPRTRKEYFQDDLFPPVRSNQASLNASQWFGGETREPILQSVRPAGMENLSEAPAVEQKKKYDFDEEQRKRASGPVSKEVVMNRFYEKVSGDWKEGETVVPVGATYDDRNDQVDEDEWSD